ncbi:phage tail tape measure protein [uncultured Pelagimonas sp.]|uniref:phage tail tape measure protein n=1 Tax=uncultured Pelagimonas sp. TaxID=1618102 RepID=UPI00262D9559|nr:phage tail tape measure protein [uncultured Pelagimonas sp.]
MAESEMMDDLQAQVDALESSIGGAIDVAAQFDQEMRKVHQSFDTAGQGASRLERSLSSGVTKAIDGVVLDGGKLSDALRTVANSMIDVAWKAAVKPMANHISGMIANGASAMFGSYSPFADGGSFSQGRVMPFANGGVVNGPVTFPMRGGMGLMGEAGPEAIMPLARGPDGKLGVRGGGGGSPVNVVMNIQTPDAQGFQRSQSQIAAQMSRALGRGARNR